MLKNRLRKVSGGRSRRIFHMDRKLNIASSFLVVVCLKWWSGSKQFSFISLVSWNQGGAAQKKWKRPIVLFSWSKKLWVFIHEFAHCPAWRGQLGEMFHPSGGNTLALAHSPGHIQAGCRAVPAKLLGGTYHHPTCRELMAWAPPHLTGAVEWLLLLLFWKGK